MAYHVPFNQRNKSDTVYIGFDEPVTNCRGRHCAPRRRFNWWGFSGLMLALTSFLTAFLTAPLALIVSLVGLRRRPRGMAIAGTLISAIPTAVIALIVVGIWAGAAADNSRRQQASVELRNSQQRAQTLTAMKSAAAELATHAEANEMLPDLFEGNRIAVQFADSWETSLRYELTAEHAVLRSAGPDRKFNTGDDMTKRLPGPVPAETHWISTEPLPAVE